MAGAIIMVFPAGDNLVAGKKRIGAKFPRRGSLFYKKDNRVG
jgi:hypothetical protein